MSWLSVLPVVATLFAEAPASVPAAQPVVEPIGFGQPVAAPPVLARPAPEQVAAPDGAATRWYGAPAVAADVTEVVLLYAVTRYANDFGNTHHVDGFDAPGAKTAAELLVVSTLLSGAVVHGLNHHGGRAAGSIAMRAGAMLAGVVGAGAYVFGRSCPNYEDAFCPTDPTILAVLLTGPSLAAMAIDDAFLARETVPAAAPAKTSWTPTLRIQSGLAMLGMGASF
jgi:hypothetical protein